jgi:hypothetical protein
MMNRAFFLYPLIFGKAGQKMEKMEVKSLSKPEEVRTFDKGKLEIINIGGRTTERATFQSG